MNIKLIRRTIYALSISLLFIPAIANAGIIYSDQTTFENELLSTIVDDYSNPAYVFNQDDATMSAVLGETDYMSTGFTDWNLVPIEYFCAGCNGSFQLGFTTTSLGTADGVFGVGMQIRFNSDNLPYDAFVTFGDNSTQSVDLGTGTKFFGVTSTSYIKSIHFGLGDGTGITTSGSFSIDDLTIGNRAQPVSEPSMFGILALGLAVFLRKNRKDSSK